MKIILAVFLCIVSINSSALCADFPQWKVWVGDPKGWGSNYRSLKKQTTITDNLEYNILELHYDLKWEKLEAEKEGKEFKLDLKIVPLGLWHNFGVFDVYDTVYRTKQIVLKVGDNNYRIIYSIYPTDQDYVMQPLPLTVIKKVDDTPLLITKVQVYRSEHYEHYIHYDPSSRELSINELQNELSKNAASQLKVKYKINCGTNITLMTCSCDLYDINSKQLEYNDFKGRLSGDIGFEKSGIVIRNIKVNLVPAH